MPGDICVLGSDGLFDNVSEEELLEEVTGSLGPVVAVSMTVQYGMQLPWPPLRSSAPVFAANFYAPSPRSDTDDRSQQPSMGVTILILLPSDSYC